MRLEGAGNDAIGLKNAQDDVQEPQADEEYWADPFCDWKNCLVSKFLQANKIVPVGPPNSEFPKAGRNLLIMMRVMARIAHTV